MTWVLGKPFVQGYTLTIADICLSYKESSAEPWKYDDCLQKIHPLHPSYGLLVGFAGDVFNAFKIVENMKIHCEEYAYRHPGKELDLDTFIREWREVALASGKFNFLGDEAVHLMVAGTTKYEGSAEGVSGFSKIAILESPTFRPMMVHPFQWRAIGSGREVDICKKVVDGLSNDFRGRILAMDSKGEDLASFITTRIARILTDELKTKGISQRLAVGITKYGATNMGMVYTETDKQGHPVMPRLCYNRESLEAYLAEKKVDSARALLKAQNDSNTCQLASQASVA